MIFLGIIWLSFHYESFGIDIINLYLFFFRRFLNPFIIFLSSLSTHFLVNFYYRHFWIYSWLFFAQSIVLFGTYDNKIIILSLIRHRLDISFPLHIEFQKWTELLFMYSRRQTAQFSRLCSACCEIWRGFVTDLRYLNWEKINEGCFYFIIILCFCNFF